MKSYRRTQVKSRNADKLAKEYCVWKSEIMLKL